MRLTSEQQTNAEFGLVGRGFPSILRRRTKNNNLWKFLKKNNDTIGSTAVDGVLRTYGRSELNVSKFYAKRNAEYYTENA